MKLTKEEFYNIYPRAIKGLYEELYNVIHYYKINTIHREAYFLGQLAHESQGFRSLEENLNYSVSALRATWPKRFPPDVAAKAARHPQQIANIAYNGRMGNAIGSNDGYKYRGRGLIQLTGKDNYILYGRKVGIDLLINPDLASTGQIACEIAGAYWDDIKGNGYADLRQYTNLTKRINGGTNGLQDRNVQKNRILRIIGSR